MGEADEADASSLLAIPTIFFYYCAFYLLSFSSQAVKICYGRLALRVDSKCTEARKYTTVIFFPRIYYYFYRLCCLCSDLSGLLRCGWYVYRFFLCQSSISFTLFLNFFSSRWSCTLQDMKALGILLSRQQTCCSTPLSLMR